MVLHVQTLAQANQVCQQAWQKVVWLLTPRNMV